MLDPTSMKEYLKGIASSTSYLDTGFALTSGLIGYLHANGTAVSPTISYTLAPGAGAGWDMLVSKASSNGVAEYIVSDWLATDFAASTKVIPAEHGTRVVPMVFNNAAVVPSMKHVDNYDQAWDMVTKAIIDFFKPEII